MAPESHVSRSAMRHLGLLFALIYFIQGLAEPTEGLYEIVEKQRGPYDAYAILVCAGSGSTALCWGLLLFRPRRPRLPTAASGDS